MYKAIVFAGTTEGYEISRFLSENKVSVLACVATEYGSRSLEENEFLSIRAERLDKEQMQELFAAERPELVLDATHPYAAEVTVNIREACVFSCIATTSSPSSRLIPRTPIDTRPVLLTSDSLKRIH